MNYNTKLYDKMSTELENFISEFTVHHIYIF